MELFRLLRIYSRPYVGITVIILLAQILSAMATLLLPSLNARIIDEGIATGNIELIWHTGGIMIAVVIIEILAAVVAVYLGARMTMGIGRDIRARIFSRVARFSAQDMASFSTATLITRGTNDVHQVQSVFYSFVSLLVTAPIMMVGGVIMSMREDAGLSWLVWVSVAVLAALAVVMILRIVPLFRALQERIDRLNTVLREQITGIRVVRAFTREVAEQKRFDAVNTDLTRLGITIGALFVAMYPLIMVVLNVSTGAVLWFGAHRVESGEVEVGSLMALLQYLLQILAAVLLGAFMATLLPHAIVCAHRIKEVLDYEPSISEPINPTPPATRAGVVELDNVTFQYPSAQAPVLDGVTFTARPGEVTAIVGATGSGKTTLLGLIPRLYAATSGTVRIDDVDVTHLARATIADRVALVPQIPYLFSGTVATNLRIARPDATDEELWEALAIAQADFVNDLDMSISQGGTNVSGGQRQRLCIARSLVSNAVIQLFDDSFSALDMLTDARLRAALTRRLRVQTMIVVAQRISSVAHADQILVLEAGRIVARGRHEELLERSTTYQEIVASQLVEEVS